MGLFNKKIVSVEVVNYSSQTKKDVGSSLLRGAVGGVALGGLGMVVGATTGKNKQIDTTTFLLKYNDGTSSTETVKNNSMMFNAYMQLVNVTETKDNNKTLEEEVKTRYEKTKKLKELLDKNLISEEEYKQLIGD